MRRRSDKSATTVKAGFDRNWTNKRRNQGRKKTKHLKENTTINRIILAATLLTGPLCAAEPAWTGFRGPEGTGVWATAKPPTTWDGATDKNIRWKVALPNWGLGQPVVMKDKVFVISEPGWKHDILENYYLTWAGERYMSPESMSLIPGVTPFDKEVA